ncbi:polysaccharide deacetylase family sporulation protein PdaB [Priestia taiwanensis]|uniref:Polysaccharide deacetylase family sporulation protein PdaB n=1 Tax=Priestia taiwanensis TaxID=1347902 RepID=A0A917ARX5_9BACI|nr:polysaccharide deacetylase family sporulation protein PdaB [Priestia taiwanensis]
MAPVVSGESLQRKDLERGYPVVWEAPMKEKLIAITFDDGPDPIFSSQVLDVLKEHQAKATFFVVGEYAKMHPEIIKREIADGHEVGNHTFTHIDILKVSTSKLKKEIEKTERIIYREGEPELKLFRPPLGNISWPLVKMMEEKNYKVVLWSWHQDTRDWAGRGAGSMATQVLTNLRNGDIILFHDAGGDRTPTVQALKMILPKLKERGYKCVTVSELLKSHPTYKKWFFEPPFGN